MSIRLIRQESQTPNVTNHDDARMVRYAYGGFDGFIKDRGSEIGYAIEGTSFIVQSGVLVLQGWEVEIDANGAAISVPPNVSTTQYFSIYLEVNCGTDTAAIKSTYRSGTYPNIPASDDLTANTVGTARLLLYQFTATNGVISNVKKAVQGIEYNQDLQNGLQEGTIIPANAKSVNSLEIKRDEKGILKIGDTIIPQKKLIWSGEVEKDLHSSDDVIIQLAEPIFSNEKIEIRYYSKDIIDFYGKLEFGDIFVSNIITDIGQNGFDVIGKISLSERTFSVSKWDIRTSEKGSKLLLGKNYNLQITETSQQISETTGTVVLTKIYKIIE